MRAATATAVYTLVLAAALALAVVPAADPGEAPAMYQVALEWPANPEPWVAGYRVHYGTSPGTYTTTVDIGDRTSVLLVLPPGTHYVATTAYNSAGVDSPLSPETVVTTDPPSAPCAPRVTSITALESSPFQLENGAVVEGLSLDE